MRKLSFITFFTILSTYAYSQNPHERDVRWDCVQCHNTEGWLVNIDSIGFDHDMTKFKLEGQHLETDCRLCHSSLKFSEAETSCISCHSDMHNNTVGDNCVRCHNSDSWLVSGITELHEQNFFPLVGAHATVNCNACHVSESQLTFEPLNTECIGCHIQEFESTTNPNHTSVGFSQDCAECHRIDAFEWSSSEVNHEFFPLTKGHEIDECAKCHIDGANSEISTDCMSCHISNFNSTSSPNHIELDLSIDCASCHTTDLDWKPAEFNEHDIVFPIYSGTHTGVWDQCTQCHTTEGQNSLFSCIDCHEHNKGDTDIAHEGISGYNYNSDACLLCHPTGDADDVFDHNSTTFPLTGAHTTTDCMACHIDGYVGTSTSCVDCHTENFNSSLNPNHQVVGISTDCASCHTTEPGWSPAEFVNHNDYYALNGAHAEIVTDCASCHNGDYNNTPNTCVGCHTEDYNTTSDPPHLTSGFSLECASCHTESAWEPSTFDHDGQYFPINSGAHAGAWNQCAECHTITSDYSIVSCVDCHEHNMVDTDNDHEGVGGYIYNSDACLVCHPTGDADDVFDHNSTAFPLTGAHTTTDCIACHTDGYAGTSTNCIDCHTEDFNSSLNPNHQVVGISTDCATCHTTEPDWSPAEFVNHNDYYALNGAHATISTDCVSCHNGEYNNTPNSCAGCHTEDYNTTADPPHLTSGFSLECASCHTESAWEPSTFDHDASAFPLTGAHTSTDCIACHTDGYAGTSTSCVDCHTADFNNSLNPNHQVVGISTDCGSCHSTQPGWSPAEFINHNDFYALNGAHATIATDCVSCHSGDYNNTPNTCAGCHTEEYNTTSDPPHLSSGFSLECASCHTESAWEPSTLDHDATAFPLTGAHTTTDCIACHIDGYVGTPTNCIDCHTADFNNSLNPNHQVVGISTDCGSCHSTQPGWSPAEFINHNDFYALNGAHATIATDCVSCHSGDYNNTPNTCAGCHTEDYNTTSDPPHLTSGFSLDCASCHTESAWEPSTLDHDATAFPLTGAHTTTDCIACHTDGYAGTSTNCVDCHTADFNNSLNPNHQVVGISTDCASCHTTELGWSPAEFVNHNDFYALNGAHATIATDCASCHNGDYNNTPNTCFGCHSNEYNQSANPPHLSAQFPTDCASCHSEVAWEPSTFDHDGQFFPIYNGKHQNEWNQCSECHINSTNYSIFSCIDCHEHNRTDTDNDHSEVSDYMYNRNACLECHPNGEN